MKDAIAKFPHSEARVSRVERMQNVKGKTTDTASGVVRDALWKRHEAASNDSRHNLYIVEIHHQTDCKYYNHL